MSADADDSPRQSGAVPPVGSPRPTADFVRLFTDSTRRIFAYILVLLPNEDAAHDVFQETSVTL